MLDVTMGTFADVEICDFSGLYILHDLKQVLTCNSYWFYRDKVLSVIDHHSKCDQQGTSRKIREIFKKHNFKF